MEVNWGKGPFSAVAGFAFPLAAFSTFLELDLDSDADLQHGQILALAEMVKSPSPSIVS